MRGNRSFLAFDARDPNTTGKDLLLLPIGASASASDIAQLALLFSLPFDFEQTAQTMFLDHLIDGLLKTLLVAILSASAPGLARKSETSDVLVKAIMKVHAGEVWFDGALMARVLNEMWLLHATGQAEAVNSDRISGTAREAIKERGELTGGLPDADARLPEILSKLTRLSE